MIEFAGKTPHNVVQRITGAPAPGLSGKQRARLKSYLQTLSGAPLDRIIAGDLLRAALTSGNHLDSTVSRNVIAIMFMANSVRNLHDCLIEQFSDRQS